ncbi:MAG: flagellar basal-body rod protein FlgG [Methylococcales bacterium]|jgi:flagellar basal-body rod protein FlgG|nr:flagellar basal-body rod protein FlgG [Methylococcales bacterium]
MFNSLFISKTGLDAMQNKLAVISNNLANVGTNGFKRDRAAFEDLLYQNIRQAGADETQDTQLPSGLQIGTGVRTVATEKLHTQGNLSQTSNTLDVAIQGRGFFQVLQPDGNIGFSRDGSFSLDSNGNLVNKSGLPVNPAITIPADVTNITIGSDGTVNATVAGSNTPTNLGNIQLADFVNPAGLQAIGGNLFTETASSGAPTTGNPGTAGLGSVQQGALETSNVNVVEELVGMIETQRAYEMNSKSLEKADQMLQTLNNSV